MAVVPTTEAGKAEAHNDAEAAVERMFGGRREAAIQEEEAQPQAESAETETQAEEGQEPANPAEAQSEEVEVEIEGEKYLVPKKISDRFIQHADYTRKTQDVAELKRVTLAEREAFNLNQAFETTVSPEKQQLALLDAQIDQFKNLNWAGIEDTGQLVRLREQLNQLKETRAGLSDQIKAKRGAFDEKIKGHVQEAKMASEKYIAQHIKGFDDNKKKELFEYGVSEGYTNHEMDNISDPRIVLSLWKAQQWDNLQRSKPGTLNRASQAAPVVRPGATQRQPSRVQQLSKAISSARTPAGKKQAAEDYFTAKFGG